MLRRSVALASLAAFSWIPASPAAAACTGAWDALPSPAAHYAEGVEALTQDDAWLVAWDTNTGGEDQGYAYHWDGAAWTKVTIPQPGVAEYVRGIGAIAPDDVWIVGSWQETTTYESHAYIAHWEDAQFTQIPVDAGTSPRLFAADGVASDDVWTVGYHHANRRYVSLAMHWDGVSWTEVATPMPDLAERFLYGVDAIAADDVWAVGSTYTRATGVKPLALHWDGVSWTNTAPRSPGPGSLFAGVAATAPNRAWAVGQVNNGEGSLIERWNGSRWKVFPVPDTGVTPTSLSDVSAVSAQKAWAVGSADATPLLFRWNGTAWRSATVPGGHSGYLAEVDSLPSGVSFVAGTNSGHILALQRCPAI
ncbi:MAG: hypothetical protein QOD78_1213 [Chloroflexota bacterium]|nr:hypothetical protein [Chloroflexota bacterium]